MPGLGSLFGCLQLPQKFNNASKIHWIYDGLFFDFTDLKKVY